MVPYGEDTSSSKGYTCKKCQQKFSSLQDCLRHDVTQHTLLNTPSSSQPSSKLINRAATQLNTSNQSHKSGRSRDSETEKEASEECPIDFKSIPDYQHVEAILAQFLMSPTELNNTVEAVVEDVKKVLRRNVYVFGSAYIGLSLKDSDIDLYAPGLPKEMEKFPKCMYALAGYFKRSNYFEKVFAVVQARVPIIICYHKKTKTKVDINISSPSSLANSKLIQQLFEFRPQIQEFMALLKVWHKQRDIKRLGNLSSYALIIMALFYLQQHKIEKLGRTYPLFDSIQHLQRNCNPDYLNYANCAYNLQRLSPWPLDIRTIDLLKGFFKFYHEITFDSVILSPFLGQIIKKTIFLSDDFHFREYKNQLLRLEKEKDEFRRDNEKEKELDKTFQTTCLVCVQDPFFLNVNITKLVNVSNLDFLKRLFDRTNTICQNCHDSADFYTTLIFDQTGSPQKKVKPSLKETLTHMIRPSAKEVSGIIKLGITSENMFKTWSDCYIKAIEKALVDIFQCKIEKVEAATPSKRKKDDSTKITYAVKCNLDLWTDRSYPRYDPGYFFPKQIEQTENLLKTRSTKKQFNVNIQTHLILTIYNERQCLEISLDPNKDETKTIQYKNSPTRKLFNALKNISSIYNVKDSLDPMT